MRSTERPLAHEAAVAAHAREAVDARDLQRLRARQRREDPAQPPSQHRLAGTGRPHEEHVVAACGGDGQRPDRCGVPAHVPEVLAAEVAPARVGRGRKLRRRIAAQDRRDAGEIGHPGDGDPFDERSLRRALARHDQPVQSVAARPLRHRQRAAARTQLAAEGELAEHRPAIDALRRHLSAGDEQPARRRQVVAGTRLREVRGRKIDRDATAREVEAGVAHRGVHALARLAYGGVTATDDREAGKTGPQVDLDGDAPRGEAVDGERGEASEHELDGGGPRVARGAGSVTKVRRRRDEFAHPRFRRRIGAEVSQTACPV